ncbi:MAG: hypothetical protein ACR2HZ_04150 [Gemmatimonadaceae bacterium]
MAALLALSAVACQHGPALADYGPALHPNGIGIRIDLRSGPDISGELLAVETDAVVVRSEERLLRVPLGLISSVEAKPMSGRTGITPRFLERAKLHSRFPGGITPEIERALLETYGQAAITTVGS